LDGYTPRRELVELAHYAAEHGERGGLVNLAVTEGRDSGRYSSCGDLIHACAYACGCRSDWINRKEFHGWEVGVNLSRIVSIVGKRNPTIHDFLPGDFGLYDGASPGAHVFVYLTRLPDGRILTADYGQPGGALRKCEVTDEGRRFRGRLVTRRVSLADIAWTVRPLLVGPWLALHGVPVAEWYTHGKTADEIVSASELRTIDALQFGGTREPNA
jgi:hypothetical protein